MEWQACRVRWLLVLVLTVLVPPGVPRPQFSLFGGGGAASPPSAANAAAGSDPPRVPDEDGDGSTVGRGSVSVSGGAAALAAAPDPPMGASTTLGVCPANGSRLLNEEVVRRPLWGVRVATVLRYDGRGCFGEHDCTVACIKIDAPHKGWRPTTAAITAGRLGGSGVELTITSPVSQGYSVRVLMFGVCPT